MIEFKKLPNGFEYIEVTNKSVTAKIALQGAHIFEFTRQGKRDILWLSPLARFEEKFPIRGGVPICWPWFGPHKDNTSLPQHGFARISKFSLVSSKEIDEETTQITLQLKDTPDTHKLWPYSFELNVSITLSQSLHVRLETINTDTKTFEITQALHTYFSVEDIENTALFGLEKSSYFDQLSTGSFIEENELRFTCETDRIYTSSNTPIIKENSKEIIIENSGSNSLVVWNPWIEKAKKIADMPDDSYKEMLCVESANALHDVITLEAGKTHILSMRLSENS
jgi:D-hexose-6-phosphate mutarotase